MKTKRWVWKKKKRRVARLRVLQAAAQRSNFALGARDSNIYFNL